jgi:hypothetical protein
MEAEMEPGGKERSDALSIIQEEASTKSVRDMVDTVPWSGEQGDGLNANGILKVCLSQTPVSFGLTLILNIGYSWRCQ